MIGIYLSLTCDGFVLDAYFWWFCTCVILDLSFKYLGLTWVLLPWWVDSRVFLLVATWAFNLTCNMFLFESEGLPVAWTCLIWGLACREFKKHSAKILIQVVPGFKKILIKHFITSTCNNLSNRSILKKNVEGLEKEKKSFNKDMLKSSVHQSAKSKSWISNNHKYVQWSLLQKQKVIGKPVGFGLQLKIKTCFFNKICKKIVTAKKIFLVLNLI